MGTTIRRQPVNFDIPNSPNYKFLNITNFRGLDVSSNPFELATNTASDCLNVYVDETNTLTTRPRLEKKIDTPLAGTHIGTYNLHNGYLLHYMQNDTGVMARLTNGVLHNISGTIPTSKCRYFEQGDKIYLLDGERYMVISDDTLKDVEGYAPTTATTDITGNVFNIEPLNLLTNKYEKKYHWDIDVKLNLKNIEYSNIAYKKDDAGFYGDGSALYTEVEIDDDSNILHFYIMYRADATSDAIAVMDLVDKTDVTLPGSMSTYFTPYNNKIMWLCNRKTGGLTIVYNHNNTWKYKTFSGLLSYNNAPIFVDDTGYIIAYPNASGAGVTQVFPETNSATSTTISKTETSLTVSLARIKHATLLFTSGHSIYVSTDFKNVVELTNNYNSIRSFGVLNTSRVFVTDRYNKTFDIFDSITGELLQTQKIDFNESAMMMGGFDDFSNSLWFIDNKYSMWVVPDITNINDNHVKLDVKLSTPVVSIDASTHFNNKNYLYLDYYTNETGSSTRKTEGYRWENTTPNIISVQELEQDTREYKDWYDKRTKLFKALLITRFDNNYWFASGNRYYRSQNNDPTYFPITEYNDLGDSNEEITGFNLANDTTLIAYKANRVYLIQPFTSSLDTREYTITESKNTVGNTAIGAPIVTTLTEIPLQINNDGIYGLSQVSNVSAIERIADLMSESINDRWLNIPDDIIAKIQTLNRLYWTYVILPYDHKTVIYLLDNRTNSWYYWELPIVLNDAFVVNNRTEFVDKNGTIYYLTTEDIIDKNYDDQTVTKYYDYGKKLIRWYWQSQILPLGTINYSKRLVNTTFILTDTDDSDGYGLKYSFKVFRKLASSVPEKEIMDKLTLVRSTTRKTNISKFSFIQIRLDNLTEESRDFEAYENNKLRLVGLGLKYVLLEGLTR